MKVESQQLKAFLIDAGILTDATFEEVAERAREQRRKIDDVLVAEKIISEAELIKLKAYILGIPFVNLEQETVSPETLKIIPEPIARSHNIVAFRKQGEKLEVAMLDPEDLATVEFIKKKTGLKILPRLTTPSSIKHMLRQYNKTLELEFGDIIKKDAKSIKTVDEEESSEAPGDLEKEAENLPVIRIVDTLIKHAILQRASDIHIEPLEKEVSVRYRIDGVLREAMVLPKSSAPGIVARVKVLSSLKLDEHRLPQDGRFKIELEGAKYSIRVSILPVFDGEKVVMRLLSESAQAITLEGLGLWGDSLERVQDNIHKPVGMILVTGPTGSGKTTSLYSMIEILNVPEVNISTVEDPIEYRMPRVNQTQVISKIGLTFASGLRSLLRQDPDVIMVGEIRDKETASLAVNAALTGHLVLSTLHTTNAVGAVPRLMDMEVEPFLLSSTLNLVLAQRLVRKLCDTKEEYFLSESEAGDLAKYCDVEKVMVLLQQEGLLEKGKGLKDIPFYRPKAAPECPDGYKGRVGIYEVLQITESVKELIGKKASSEEIQAQARKEGMMTMVEDGFVKAARGITSIEEVLRVISE